MWLNRPKPWLHIALGVILALALTVTINPLVVRYGEKIGYEQPMRTLEAQSAGLATESTSDLTVKYIWQQPSSLYTVIFSMLTAFLLASLIYLILNHIVAK